MFEAANHDQSVIVHVGRNGDTRAVQLEPTAMDLPDGTWHRASYG